MNIHMNCAVRRWQLMPVFEPPNIDLGCMLLGIIAGQDVVHAITACLSITERLTPVLFPTRSRVAICTLQYLTGFTEQLFDMADRFELHTMRNTRFLLLKFLLRRTFRSICAVHSLRLRLGMGQVASGRCFRVHSKSLLVRLAGLVPPCVSTWCMSWLLGHEGTYCSKLAVEMCNLSSFKPDPVFSEIAVFSLRMGCVWNAGTAFWGRVSKLIICTESDKIKTAIARVSRDLTTHVEEPRFILRHILSFSSAVLDCTTAVAQECCSNSTPLKKASSSMNLLMLQ
jgi:hypothetical protein